MQRLNVLRKCNLLSSLLFYETKRRAAFNHITIIGVHCARRDESEGSGGLCARVQKGRLPARQNPQALLITTLSPSIPHIQHTNKQNQQAITMSDDGEPENCPYPLPTDSIQTQDQYGEFRCRESLVSDSYAGLLETGMRLQQTQAEGKERRIAWASLRLERLQITHARLEADMDEAEMEYFRASRVDRKLAI